MATLTTKFDMGQTVYFANTTTETFRHACPDCLGSKEWEAKSPAGAVFKVACPRCSQSYQSNDALNLNYTKFVPSVQKLTVGLIRASSMPGDGFGKGTEYMCLETGIGSGNLYRESKLFATEDEARASAQLAADETNANPDFWVAKQYDKTAKFCDYELKDAVMEAAMSRARQQAYRVQYLVEDLKESDTITDVRERIARWEEAREAGEEV